MQHAISALCVAAAFGAVTAVAAAGADPAVEVLALERQAMNAWLKGDPDPQLAISDPQITYFHDVLEKRLEGLPAVKTLYEQYRGVPLFDRYEIVEPQVQVSGDVAVLTYQLVRHNGGAITYWHATQVYRRQPAGWRVFHTHWSAAKRS